MDSGRALIERLTPLIDERSGVLSRVSRITFPPGYEGQMFGFSAEVARHAALQPLQVSLSEPLVGHGTALDETTAKVRSLCEAIERYCSVMYPTAGVRFASRRELGGEAIDLGRLPRASAREKARARPFDLPREPGEDDKLAWVRGYSLTRAAPRWIPLTAAYMGLPLPVSEHVILPISTGFAAGGDLESAILSGLFEVIERDSLALFWLHQLPMPRLSDPAALGPGVEELVERAARAGITSHLFDWTTDVGVPVVGVVQTTERGAPHVVAMGACRATAAAAAQRVLEEAGSLRVGLAYAGRAVSRASFDEEPARPPEDFGLLYAGEDGPARFAFATEGAPARSAPPPPLCPDGGDALRAIVRRLADLDMEVLVVDVTQPEIRDFGIVVVKVVVPELMPITFSHAVRYLAHPRLYRAPESLGYGARSEGGIVDDPIPFS
ncbi:YcaO-like family protein [Sorangium sp. So ce131]|uniref:YcaO-like family protein n=1 Tax=Sorangium sp. So ce131 TaxID=3133282 RepID=UPI003F619B18